MKILANDDVKFEEFCGRLSEAIENDGCDSETLLLSDYILRTHYPEYDTEGTIEYFQSKGGYCDCEVLFNVCQYPK